MKTCYYDFYCPVCSKFLDCQKRDSSGLGCRTREEKCDCGWEGFDDYCKVEESLVTPAVQPIATAWEKEHAPGT